MSLLMPDPFGWLDAHSGAVQGVSTAILVVFTAVYAWLTRRIASETRAIAAEARAQRLDTARPVVLFKLIPVEWQLSNPDLRFTLEMLNGGCGPALDVQVKSDLAGFQATPLLQPFSLSVGDSVERAFWVRAREFDDNHLLGGEVKTSYRDIYGRYFVSAASLECTHPLRRADGTGGPQLGPTSVEGPFDVRPRID
jgi:hypothetical protein